MADGEEAKPEQTASQAPKAGLTVQEQIDQEMARREAVKAAKPAESAAPAEAAAVAAPAAAAAPAPSPADSPALQQAIARQREKLKAKLAGKTAGATGGGTANAPLPVPASPAASPAPVAAAAAGPAGKLQTTGGENVSLQEVIARQREKLKMKLSGPEGDNKGATSAASPAPSRADAQGGGLMDKAKPGEAKDHAAASEQAPAGAAGQVVLGGRGKQMMIHLILLSNTVLLALVVGVLLYTLTIRTSHPSNSADEAMKVIGMVQAGSDKAAKAEGGQSHAAQTPPIRFGPTAPVAPVHPTATAPAASPRPVQVAAVATKPAGAASKPAEVVPPSAGQTAAAPAAPAAASWESASAAFERKDYDKALDRYSQLLLATRGVPAEEVNGEFFQYRIAACMWQLGKFTECRKILDKLLASPSPVLRSAASAVAGRMDETAGQYLQARTLALQAIAAMKASREPLALEADCDYLVCRCLTGRVNSFITTDHVIPWSRLRVTDPFLGRDKAACRHLLDDGVVDPAAAGASTVRIESAPGGTWTVECVKTPLEDVLHQFAAKAGKDVQWGNVPEPARRRSVSFVLRQATEQRINEVACGMVGLVAGFTWDQVTVSDPVAMTGLAEEKDLLAGEAIAAWRRFSLKYPQDIRVPEGHFALAALYEWSGDTTGAMKQYQTVGRQYPQELELAPQALMRSAKLWIDVRNYAGARSDLLDLLDLYPQYPRSDEVYLSLGRVNMQAGKYDQALRVFLKVQGMNTSVESRQAACLEAGECFYRLAEYKDASKWLSQYITLAETQPTGGVMRAYVLLGQSQAALGNGPAAVAAFRRALSARAQPEEYVEAILAMAEVQAKLGDFLGALGTLRRAEGKNLPDEQAFRRLMTASRIYRLMGLPDRARAMLRRDGASVTDTQRRAALAVEQARCLWEAGDLIGARQGMAEAMGKLSGGLAGWETALDLAEVCMAMSDPQEAAVMAREVLRGTCPDPIRRRASETLGRAYLAQKQYDKAAEVLSSLGPDKLAAPTTAPAAPAAVAALAAAKGAGQDLGKAAGPGKGGKGK
jgi:tetratricopeptide (TPR) repeat protein